MNCSANRLPEHLRAAHTEESVEQQRTCSSATSVVHSMAENELSHLFRPGGNSQVPANLTQTRGLTRGSRSLQYQTQHIKVKIGQGLKIFDLLKCCIEACLDAQSPQVEATGHICCQTWFSAFFHEQSSKNEDILAKTLKYWPFLYFLNFQQNSRSTEIQIMFECDHEVLPTASHEQKNL